MSDMSDTITTKSSESENDKAVDKIRHLIMIIR